MKVKDLIKELELFDMEEEVCREDSDASDQNIETVQEVTTVTSPHIKYVVIG